MSSAAVGGRRYSVVLPMAAALVLLLLPALVPYADAASIPVLTEAGAEKIQKLLAPPPELGPGADVDIRIFADSIRAEYRHGDGASAGGSAGRTLLLLTHSSTCAEPALPHFCATIESAGVGFAEAEKAVLATLARRDVDDPWVATVVEGAKASTEAEVENIPTEPWKGLPGTIPVYYILQLLWLSLPLLLLIRLAIGGFSRPSTWSGELRKAVFACLALTLAALLVDTFAVPTRVFHFFTPVAVGPPDQRTQVGLGWPALTALIHFILPNSDLPPFLAARFFGCLVPASVYLFLKRLTRNNERSLIAAGFAVLLPYFISMGAGDGPYPAVIVLFSAGFLFGMDYLDGTDRRQGFASLAASFICFTLMVHSRLESGFYLAALPLILPEIGATLSKFRRNPILLAGLSLVFAGMLYAAFGGAPQAFIRRPGFGEVVAEAGRSLLLFPAMGDASMRMFGLLGGSGSTETIGLDWVGDFAFTPWIHAPLLWLGYWVCRREPWLMKWAAAILFIRLSSFIYSGIGGENYLGARHFLAVFPLQLFVASSGTLWLWRTGSVALRIAGASVVGVCWALQAPAALNFEFTFQREYDLLKEWTAKLPVGAVVLNIKPDAEYGLDPAEGPLILARPDIEWVNLYDDNKPRLKPGAFAYLGPDCGALEGYSDSAPELKEPGDAGRRAIKSISSGSCRWMAELPFRGVVGSGSVPAAPHGLSGHVRKPEGIEMRALY